MYIITAPKDVAEVFKKPDALAWDDHLNQLFLNFGFNPESLKRAWLKPVDLDSRYESINPHRLPLIKFVESIYTKQLLPGVRMDRIGESFVSALQASFHLSNLETCSVRADTCTRTVSLLRICQYTLLEAGIYSFFGKTILEIDSNVIPKLLDFTENAWMLFYALPSFFASAVFNPQNEVLRTFQRFAELPENLRGDQSWGVQQILIAQECLGIDMRSRACMLLMILWA